MIKCSNFKGILLKEKSKYDLNGYPASDTIIIQRITISSSSKYNTLLADP